MGASVIARYSIVPIVRLIRSGMGAGLLVVLICALFGSACGYAYYYSSVRWFQASTSEQKTTALRLIDAFYATYAGVRNDYMNGNAPVPSSFRAHAIERYNRDLGANDALRLIMVGPPGREIATPPADTETVDAIRRFSEAPKPLAETAFFTSGKEALLRTIYPSIASEQSCVDCHNQMRPDIPQWKLNDVMGAFVLSVRADTYLKRSAEEAAMLGVLIFAVATGICFFSLLLQRHIALNKATERELRTAKIEADAANLAKTRFLETMSHEIRNPLNAILGYSDIIMREMAGPLGNGMYRDYARGINGSGEHLLSIVNDILDLSKIEAGHMTLHDDVIDIAKIIESCFQFVQLRADDAGVTLNMIVAKGFPALVADELRLKQIILNLLSNAVKFTPSRVYVAEQ